MISFLTMATILCTGLMIGVEFGVSAFINPVLQKLDDEAQAQAVRLFAGLLGKVMPIWYSMGLVLLVAECIALRQTPWSLLADLAAGIWVLVIVLTLIYLVPVNNRIARMKERSFSQEKKREHRKWDRLHRFRVAALMAAMICFLAALRL